MATVSVWIYITVKNWPQLVCGYILQLKNGHSECMDIYYSYKLATVSVWTNITVKNWPQLVYGQILQLKIGHR